MIVRYVKSTALWIIHRFPKGSIWQTRYICFPIVVSVSTLTLSHPQLPFTSRLLWFGGGLFTWTFFEYLLHRWFLHWQPRTSIDRALLERFHIFHHNDPADQSHVCMPLILDIPLWILFYTVSFLLSGNFYRSLLFTSGIALMMVIYDIAHFSAHYMKASNPLLKLLKKHHMLHHFSDHTTRFGVTSPLWDYVFRTHK